MTERTWIDVTGTLIDALSADWDGVIVPAVPKPRPAEFVVVRRVGGGDDGVVDRARMFIEVWSGTPGDSLVPVHSLAAQIRDFVRLAPFTSPGTGLAAVTIDTFGYLPDPITGCPRIVMSCTVVAKPTTGS